jgi:hypothetical protein
LRRRIPTAREVRAASRIATRDDPRYNRVEQVMKLLIENSYLRRELHRMANRAHRPEPVRAVLAEHQGADMGGARGPSGSRRKDS